MYFSTMGVSKRDFSRQVIGRRGEGIPAFFLYGEPLQAPDERLIHIETIAARSALNQWKIEAHRHRDLNQVLLLRRGRVRYELDAQRGSLRAPALLAVPPGTVHSFTFQPATDGVVLSFATSLAAEIAPSGTVLGTFLEQPAAQAVACRSAEVTDLFALADMLLREFTRSAPGRQTALRGILGAVLASALRLASLSPAPNSRARGSDRELVARFRRLIELGYRTHRNITDYSQELGVTQSRLRRSCLAVTGQPPVAILHLRLLIEAERQLRYTTMSIAQIAWHLGFEDPAYFSRFFSRRMHTSPRAFRAREIASVPARAAGSSPEAGAVHRSGASRGAV
ncbi:MAG: helix-turn-helix domain-containing protein [Proteobacteria bacterium]|nr:helix-turn-helix domain-containing protein [Pseudomonadota bacterium]